MNLLEQYGWKTYLKKNSRGPGSDVSSETVGRIVTQYGKSYTLAGTEGLVSVEAAGTLHHRGIRPAVGDWVEFTPGEPGIIRSVLPRYSAISRKVAGSETAEQVIAANVDIAFIVIGMDQNYSVARAERYLTAVYESGAEPVIILNKIDLCSPETIAIRQAEIEEIAFGVPVFLTSALEKIGTREIALRLTGGLSAVFLGSSGVGKSSVINHLLEREVQKTDGTRKGDGKGKHTTTRRELFPLSGGGILIDTPGMKELQLWADPGGNEEKLTGAFADIEETAANCRFRDCSHESEPGCAVRAALEVGELDAGHYGNYLKMKRELNYLERRQDERLQKEEVMKFVKVYRDAKAKKQMNRGEYRER